MGLSVVILTHNSSKTIKTCLDSVLFADEVLIVDDYSTDEMDYIIKNYLRPLELKITYRAGSYPKIKYIKHRLDDDFSSQRNFALEQCTQDWVLYLDSDEFVSPELKEEITRTMSAKSSIQGYHLKRDDLFFGKLLKHGETSQVKLLRLAKKNVGSWRGKVHETWQINGETKILKHALIHKRIDDISKMLGNISWYSTLQAQEFYHQKRREPLLYIFFYPKAKFIQNYLLFLGYLDGWQGFCMAFLMTWHSFLVRIKLQLLNRNKGKMYFSIPQ